MATITNMSDGMINNILPRQSITIPDADLVKWKGSPAWKSGRLVEGFVPPPPLPLMAWPPKIDKAGATKLIMAETRKEQLVYWAESAPADIQALLAERASKL